MFSVSTPKSPVSTCLDCNSSFSFSISSWLLETTPGFTLGLKPSPLIPAGLKNSLILIVSKKR